MKKSLPVPQVVPLYPVAQVHVNVVISQVPPYWHAELSAQAPIKRYYNCEDSCDVLYSSSFKYNEDNVKNHEHDEEDNCREYSINNDYDGDDIDGADE